MISEAFVTSHTVPARPEMVPEIALYLASEITPIWQATEDFLAGRNLAPPFWAFAWPGGQAMARHLLDNPELARDRCVLDFAAGSGIAAIAAALAGGRVEAAEIDVMAVATIGLNAALNGVCVNALLADLVGQPCRWDLILAGDICYEAPMTRRVLPWLRDMAAGAEIWLADPGRAYLPRTGLQAFAEYHVPTTPELEDCTLRRTILYRLSAHA